MDRMQLRRGFGKGCMRRLLHTMTGPIEAQIRRKLAVLEPRVLEIANDSAKHAHHTAMRGSTNQIESHFRLTIVSSQFAGVSKPMRHRMVYKLLSDELNMPDGLHAVQMTTRTPEEAEASQK